MAQIRALPRHIPLALLAFVMLLRVLVPAGYMPTTDADGIIRISICTGMGAQAAFIDRDGKLHKETPGSGHHDPQPCGFGVLSFGLDATPDIELPAPAIDPDATVLVALQTISIGHGLAAPPPPSTGPPSLI